GFSESLYFDHLSFAAEHSIVGSQFLKNGPCQADLRSVGETHDAGANVHRVAAHNDAVGQNRAVMDPAAHGELLFPAAVNVFEHDRVLKIDHRLSGHLGGRETGECAVSGRVHNAAFGSRQNLT